MEKHGIKNTGVCLLEPLHTAPIRGGNPTPGGGRHGSLGPLVVRTGEHTGRSPNDKFVVREPSSEAKVCWGPVNKAMEQERFASLQNRLLAYLQGKDLFVQDCFAGAGPSYRLPIRVITETARHNLFARNMFIQAKAEELAGHAPQFIVINAPNFHAVPEVDGTQKLVLIGGTQHARGIKKSIFTVMNYFLPQQQVLSMHCSANAGTKEDVAALPSRAW